MIDATTTLTPGAKLSWNGKTVTFSHFARCKFTGRETKAVLKEPAGLREAFFQVPVADAQRAYYDNSHLCPECTGAGCRRCYDASGLKRLGSERFPLSLAVSGCQPPAILRMYATNY